MPNTELENDFLHIEESKWWHDNVPFADFTCTKALRIGTPLENAKEYTKKEIIASNDESEIDIKCQMCTKKLKNDEEITNFLNWLGQISKPLGLTLLFRELNIDYTMPNQKQTVNKLTSLVKSSIHKQKEMKSRNGIRIPR